MPAADAVARLLGGAATAVRPLGGTAVLVRVGDRQVVAKRHDEPGAAAAEAASLRWLAGPVPVPDLLAADEHWLVTEYVPGGADSAAVAEQLGRGLAGMHALGADAFGVAPPGGPADAWIGHAPMRNTARPSWPGWFAEHRVLPYLRLAVDRGAVTGAQAAPVERVCARIDDLAGPPEPPARLHGDLWSGNVLWGEHGAWVIDPAAHGGHRESDLAMLALFGCPQLDRVRAAYHEASPLAAGWPDRVALHQLFPLLVHAVLFGGGYGAQAASAARTLGR